MSADVRESKRPAVIDRRYNAIFSHLLRLSLPPRAEASVRHATTTIGYCKVVGVSREKCRRQKGQVARCVKLRSAELSKYCHMVLSLSNLLPSRRQSARLLSFQ